MRKKRCDEIRPLCKNCSALEITCYFDEQKPLWMDGGSEQRQKAEEIKREVKSAAARHRGIMPLDVLDLITADADNEPRLANDAPNGRSLSDSSQPNHAEAPGFSTGCNSSSTQHSTELSSSSFHHNSWSGPNSSMTNDSSHVTLGESELDRRFMMFYFFPFLPISVSLLQANVARGRAQLDHGACCT